MVPDPIQYQRHNSNVTRTVQRALEVTNFVDNVSTYYSSLIPRLHVKLGNEATTIVGMECMNEDFFFLSSRLAVIKFLLSLVAMPTVRPLFHTEGLGTRLSLATFSSSSSVASLISRLGLYLPVV